MPRPAAATLVSVIVLLIGANAIVCFHSQRGAAPAYTRADSAWARWLALTTGDRLAYVQRYEALARRGDAGVVLQRAREFAQLPFEQQERLRSVQRAYQETLDQQTTNRRRELLRSPPRARAFFVYQALLAHDPERLATLRAQWSDTP